jgi:putative transposase
MSREVHVRFCERPGVQLPGPTPLIVLNKTVLRHILKSYFEYYERTRTHLSLQKDAPIPRRVQPPELGKVVELPEVGGLHHRYERRAA